jgi:hypothetical protein
MNFLIKVLMVFLTIFDLSFKIAPAISSGKIVVSLLSLYYIFKKIKVKNLSKGELLIFISYFFIFTHVVLVYIFNGMPETTTLARFIYYLIYSVWLSFVFTKIFDSKRDFLNVLTHAIFIQSCFVIISWFSLDYRILVDQLLVQTGNISLLSARRPPGLMNSAGAKASVTLGIGAATGIYMIALAKKRKEVIKYSIFLLINLVATFIVGRTGLLIFTGLALAIIIQEKKKVILNRKFLIVFITTLLLFVFTFMIVPEEFNENIIVKSEWVFGEFADGLFKADTVSILRSMSIKELGAETLVGTSQIRLPDGQHDSGYIQNYHSMGLIFSIIFYITVFFHTIVLVKSHKNTYFIKKNILFILFLIAGLFIVEIKEPFILSYTYPMIIYTLLRLPEEKTPTITNKE